MKIDDPDRKKIRWKQGPRTPRSEIRYINKILLKDVDPVPLKYRIDRRVRDLFTERAKSISVWPGSALQAILIALFMGNEEVVRVIMKDMAEKYSTAIKEILSGERNDPDER